VVKKIKSYLSTNKKDIFLCIIATAIITAAYLSYLYFVGVPMTKAQILYNQALTQYQEGKYQQADESIKRSIKYFKEDKSLKLEQDIKDYLVD